MADPKVSIDDLFGTFRQSRFNEEIDPNRLPQSDGPGTGNPQPTGFIQPGVVTATTFDTTAPAAPTGLTLSSDVVPNSDGTTYVRLLVGLVQPSDTDLYGSYVEITQHNDGAGNPVWDRPILRLIAKGQTQTRVDNVQGVTQFWARARAADVLGNFSGYTSVVTHTTVGDTTAPPRPSPAVLTAGFKGFGASWTGGDAVDLAYYEVRWAAAAAAPDADDGAWAVARSDASRTFITGLIENVLYWFEVRGVDLSGNRSAWSVGTSVTPNLIGSTDIAANTITAAMIQAGALDADKIGTGTLRINTGLSGYADGIIIFNGSGQEVGRWDENGLNIREAGTSRYVILDGGQLKFTTDDGATYASAVTPDGVNASAVTFGSAAGGHNLAINSSFELAAFVAASSTAMFTDNSGTPAWKAANRTTAPVNTTEGTADLQITAMAY